jgi:hypothetical protein
VTKTAMKTTFAEFENRLREFIRGISPLNFDTLALELFRLQFDRVPAYRRFCEAEGRAPGTVESWTEIPVLPTTAFKEFELTSIPAAARTKVFESSGTTGHGHRDDFRAKPGAANKQRSRHFHDAQSLAIYEFSSLMWARQHLPLDTSLLFLTPPPARSPHSSLVHMFDLFRRSAGCESLFVGRVAAGNGWQIDIPHLISKCAELVDRRRPVGLLGTAFSLVHLLDELTARKLHFELPRASWVLETGGYKGRSRSVPKPELYQMISEVLGVSLERIVCEYGMTELSSQAYDASLIESFADPRRFHFPPWARAEIISPETGCTVPDGKAGLIRVWDLANVYSVMAIETQDLAIRHGSAFGLIGRAEHAEARGCSLMTV